SQRDRLMRSHHSSLLVACGKQLKNACDAGGDDAYAHEHAPMLDVLAAEQVEGADGGHYKGSGNDGAAHVVRVLPAGPGIQNQLPEAGELEGAVGGARIADGVLHPGVSSDDEIARKPGAEKHGYSAAPVGPSAKALFAVQEQAQECRLQEEGEHAFHGQGLADHAPGKTREMRPVGAKLEFHGNAGDHTQHEVD